MVVDSAAAAVLGFLAVLGLHRDRLLPSQACRLAEGEEEDLKLFYPFWFSLGSSRNSTHFISLTSIKILENYIGKLTEHTIETR